MEEPLNPYATPETPSDQIANQDLEASKADEPYKNAFRKGEYFYCNAEFESPKVCFRSGVGVTVGCEKRKVVTPDGSVELYFLPDYIQSKARRARLNVIVTFFIFTFSIIIGKLYGAVLGLIVLVVFIGYRMMAKSDKAMTVNTNHAPEGFVEIKGGHERFLQLFPQEDFTNRDGWPRDFK